MGYTHYWRSAPKLTNWALFAKVVTEILAVNKVPVQFESDDPRPVEVTDSRVRFNGVGADGHETFYFMRDNPLDVEDVRTEKQERRFAFCKTATKPYDAVVCAVLLAANEAFGAEIDVSSDGTWGDWSPGRRLFLKATGYEAHRPTRISVMRMP